MSDTTPLTCASCGDAFEPSAELLARFPGWTPKECARCYRGANARPGGTGSRNGGSRSSGGRRSGSGARNASLFAGEQQLTLAQVLERYDGGPDSGVFTDGSASPNPGPGGWGAVYVVAGEVIAQDHGHDPDTTNNRMELTALLHGLELVPAGTPAIVHSDSNLAVRTINEWAAGWAARGWRRKTGPVENLDLVQPLYEAAKARPELEIRWIKAHAGNRWNEYADSLATAYAREIL